LAIAIHIYIHHYFNSWFYSSLPFIIIIKTFNKQCNVHIDLAWCLTDETFTYNRYQIFHTCFVYLCQHRGHDLTVQLVLMFVLSLRCMRYVKQIQKLSMLYLLFTGHVECDKSSIIGDNDSHCTTQIQGITSCRQCEWHIKYCSLAVHNAQHACQEAEN